MKLHKYPRTRHLKGSRLQPGDHDLLAAPFAELVGRQLVVEEKLDGVNAAISFDPAGRLWLQSRGHYLTGGPSEQHFDLLKTWTNAFAEPLRQVLGARYVLYGEWLYAKHTIYYDRLPHYFLEFDLLDTTTGHFLSTASRRALLAGSPVASVPVLWSGLANSPDELVDLVGPSLYKSAGGGAALASACRVRGLDPEQIGRETDPSNLMEGLFIRVEEAGQVIDRFKYVRSSFLKSVLDSGSHWLTRPIVPNGLAAGAQLFGSPA
ncbi:RNA ligase [Singulisphaera sp. GP187]|uniref:RNA ligase family protein n=1 Tax=Singulisphaera sp. GP187 TaxID=1882752 RepID=UPI0009296BF0|nr:RNA ligase family protein [Singulisphaera sp. GP187]SIO36569.1 RNA ligase [Singulisphaera sp. GP187]